MHIRRVVVLVIAMVLLLCTPLARSTTVRDACRISGQGVSVIQGLGIVTGLRGTGDSGKDLALALPLAEVLKNNGLQVPDLAALRNSRSVALVMVTCETPAEGAHPDDRFDLIVTTLHSATSLAGGELYLSPLTGPYRGAPVYAMASGTIELDDPTSPTRGRVRHGAKMIKPILPPPVGDIFDLIIQPRYAGYASSAHIASRIRDEYLLRPQGHDDLDPIAQALDDRTIRITVPPAARARRSEFIADIMGTAIDPTQMKLAAKVIVNRASGAIIVTGDVEISLVAITHRNLVIRRLVPPPEPTPADPIIETDRVIGIGSGRPRDRARLDDLLNALKQLNVPVDEQIQLLQMLHKTGRLHAELIVD
ncbi:MAG: flagellar basal body P-ring protein FlgI [Phycisphaeraceae bacterium]|nr:flagellar basal body P-ring protein FlgI [Phycisphaeraceae bacterium]MCW5754620.1 flagellar basal body P-ring protein FlgI [Phycisphaeraceae bacterium]